MEGASRTSRSNEPNQLPCPPSSTGSTSISSPIEIPIHNRCGFDAQTTPGGMDGSDLGRWRGERRIDVSEQLLVWGVFERVLVKVRSYALGAEEILPVDPNVR